MEIFPVTTELEVRWRDTDALGHVNNAVYFSYFEMGRIAYHRTLYGDLKKSPIRFIMASAACDYVKPLFVRDRVAVSLKVSAVGRRSFDFVYEARRAADGELVARGRSTQVFYDYGKNEACEPPPGWIERIEEFQGEKLVRKESASGKGSPPCS